MKLAYTGANSRLGLSGEKVSGLTDVSHTIDTPADVVTMGTGESTVVGADNTISRTYSPPTSSPAPRI